MWCKATDRTAIIRKPNSDIGPDNCHHIRRYNICRNELTDRIRLFNDVIRQPNNTYNDNSHPWSEQSENIGGKDT